MISQLKNKSSEFIEAAANRSLHKFYNRRDNHYVNHKANVQSSVSSIYMQHRANAVDSKAYYNFKEVGFSVYSQYDEDGILLWLLGSIGIKTRSIIDIGSGNGIFASNAANLINNFGFTALLAEINPEGKKNADAFYAGNMMTAIYPPCTVCSAVDRDNVNALISDNGFGGEVDVLSLDIDSNDYWVWEAINSVSPRIVVLENNLSFGRQSVAVPYDAGCAFLSKHPEYYGASAKANMILSEKKGYHLVAGNIYGINSFFLRNDLRNNNSPEISLDDILAHPLNAKLSKRWDELKDYPFASIA